MARNDHTPEQFELIASELSELAAALNNVAYAMRDAGMPSALIHGTMTQNTHLPAVIDWVGKVTVDVKAQIRAYRTGVKSKAEIAKQQTEQQKLAAARKPVKKKAT